MIHADSLREHLIALEAVVFDFDGVFTDNVVRVNQNGVESVSCWRSDGLGLKRIADLNVKTLILSTEENPVVTVRAKAHALQIWVNRNNLEIKRVAYVGNDINDVPAFKVVGFPVAVGDAYPEILPHVLYRTVKLGGRGAVREVCDLIFHAKQGGLNGLKTYVP